MATQSEQVAHADLVGGGQTSLHSHAGGGSDLKPFLATDTSGNQAITTNITINLNNVAISNANYSLASNEVTCVTSGTYWVSFSICYDITNTSGSTRGATEAWVEDDDSGSYAVSPGSYARVYHREAAGGSGLSNGFPLYLANGNRKIRLRATRYIYTTNIDTSANKVQLSLMKVG